MKRKQNTLKDTLEYISKIITQLILLMKKEICFHRVTHSKTSGGRKNWKIDKNPISGHREPMHIVKQEQKDSKNRFSMFEIELKKALMYRIQK